MKKSVGVILAVFLPVVVFSMSPAVAGGSGDWAVGVYEDRGSYVVEDDNGVAGTTGVGPGVVGRYRLNKAEVLRLAGNFQTAGDRNFQLNFAYLQHFGAGAVRPFVGPGIKMADSAVAGDNHVALEAQAGVRWNLGAESLSLAVSTVPAMLTLAPETDVYGGRPLRLELYHRFD